MNRNDNFDELNFLYELFKGINSYFFNNELSLDNIILQEKLYDEKGSLLGMYFSSDNIICLSDHRDYPYEFFDTFIHELAHLVEYHILKHKVLLKEDHDEYFWNIHKQLLEYSFCLILQDQKLGKKFFYGV